MKVTEFQSLREFQQLCEQEFLTPPEAAAIMRVHHGKVIGLINTGELKASNLATNANGKQPRWRIRKSDLETFLQARSNRIEPAPAPKVQAPRRVKQYV